MIGLLAVVALVQAIANPQASPEILSAYRHPHEACHIVIRNNGSVPLTLGIVGVKQENGEHVPTFWIFAEPDTAEPDECLFVHFMMQAPIPSDAPASLVLSSEAGDLPFTLEGTPSLVVTYTVYVPESRTLYCYARNNTSEPLLITALEVGGVPVRLSRSVRIPAGRKGLVYGIVENVPSSSFDVPPLHVRLTHDQGETEDLFTRLFRPEHTVMRSTTLAGARDTITCLTHAHGAPEQAAAAAIAAARESLGSRRTIKFCNMDLDSDGPRRFAQLTERNHIEPQLTYFRECASSDYGQVLLAAMEETKTATEPGISYAWVFPADIHSPSPVPFGVARLRNMMCALLAGGSKGLELFAPTFDDPGARHAQNNGRLLAEMASLTEYVALSEPVDLLEVPKQTGFNFRTLLCGDKGVLLFVLPENDPPQPFPSTVSAFLRSVGYPLSLKAVEVGGMAKAVPLRAAENGRLLLEVPLETYAQVFLIPAD